jgi:hypothetical protein
VDNKRKQNSYEISDTINILVQVDAHIELASPLILSVSMLNTTVKNREETERSYAQYGPFSNL